MTNYTRFILIIYLFLTINILYSQSDYNDLYFSNLKGKIKNVSTTTINYDTDSWTFGHYERILSNYNNKGNCVLELEYLDTSLIKTRINIFQTIDGVEQRLKKITIHAVDTSNKTIAYYFSDNIGFDTSIIVCDIDSSYQMRYVYERNEKGLRTKGTEYNAKNGNKNYSFEIFYFDNGQTDSIIYRNRFDAINYIEYYFYNSYGEMERIKYSDDDRIIIFIYNKRDKYGNWVEKETFYVKENAQELINRQIRIIEYY